MTRKIKRWSKDEIQENYKDLAVKIKRRIYAMVNKRAHLPHKELTDGKFNNYTYKAMEVLGMIKKQDAYQGMYVWTYGDDEDEIDLQLGETIYETARGFERDLATNREKDPKPKRKYAKKENVVKDSPVTKIESMPQLAPTSATKSNGVIFSKEQLLFINRLNVDVPVVINGVRISNIDFIDFEELSGKKYKIKIGEDVEVTCEGDLLIDRSTYTLEIVTI